MRIPGVGWLATMLLVGSAAMGWAQDQAAQSSEMTGPEQQIVRVSFVEGDVRVSRGPDAEKQTRSEWEKAAVDLPIEAGYSLVTGAGRAEIEFEDASVAYLAENSVLVFNDLDTSSGIPRTELALLSGAMSVAATPMVLGEWFVVRTPTDRFTMRYPDRTFVRVNSYLDGMTVTSMGSTVFRLDRTAAIQTNGGQTIAYSKGKRVDGEKLADQTSYAEFDQWVLHRAMARSTAMAETMKEAGLKEPVPGLAQLQGQGHFYACPPYGTCWEPTNGFAGQATDAEKAAMARQTVSATTLAKGGPNGVLSAGGSLQNQGLQESIESFPCSPFRWDNMYQFDPATGQRRLLSSQLLPTGYWFGTTYPYQWAVCHTGSWIVNHRRYVWVTGTKRHHYPPVHWVKLGHAVGFVPIHPKDVAGKTPLNLKEGFVHPVDKSGSKVEVLAYNSSERVKLLAEAPRSFLKESYVPLSRAEAPRAEAHVLKAASEAKAAGTPITFDHKTQSFMVSRQGGSAAVGGSSRTMEPIGGRGSDLQAHAGGSEMSRGGASGSNSGSYARGSSGSSGYSGGSGSASHASAPASAPAPSAPSGGGSSSAAASSGGGKH